MLALVMVAAIVTQDATPLRAMAKETAARQTLLYAGDWLELRGERQGWLQVYDHRHERPGYVRPSQVRTYAVEEGAAHDLAAIVDFLRDQPGAESLGIGYAALFLRVAPASAVGAELLDALGGMAERLARRASSRWARPGDATLAGQIEVAESYGIKLRAIEAGSPGSPGAPVEPSAQGGRARLCYDGEAFRRVLALPASPSARARAALALTEPACAAGRPLAWQVEVLDHADPATMSGPMAPWLINRLRLRRATVRALAAYAAARQGDWKAAGAAAEAGTRELALVDKGELSDDDTLGYDEAAVRVGAVRWATEPTPPPQQRGLGVALAAGKPGETCVRVTRGKVTLTEHCTYAVVWPASVRVAPRGDLVTLAQSPLPSWTELVLLHTDAHREAETLAPAAVDPDLGYVELAGVSPDGAHLLVAREARLTGPLGQPGTLAPWMQKSFQILRAGELTVEKQAAHLDNFVSFRRWQSPDWRRATLALR